MNIGQYRKYCEENFEVSSWRGKIHDKRRRPQITPLQVFESVSQMPVFAQKSLLELDGFLRLSGARKLHDSDREMVASDSSVARITKGMSQASVQAIGYEVIDKSDELELLDIKLPSGRKLRMGIVDGHHAGNVWASVFAVSGKSDGVVDLERYPGLGHELGASRTVMKRVFDKLGNGYFEIVGADGLYSSREDFQLCLSRGSHLLVKTDEETLTVIQDARYLFDAPNAKNMEGIGWSKGLDDKRAIEYEVMWVEGLEWQGVRLTVARVKEHHLKPRKDRPENTVFWVLTTAAKLTGEDLRELAHRRWRIENNIFKRLNFLVKSKKHWSRDPSVMELYLRMWMIGLTLLGAYWVERGFERFRECCGVVKQTWKAVAERMQRSLISLYSD